MAKSIGEFELETTRESPDPCCFAYKAVRRGTSTEVELRVTGGCESVLACFDKTASSVHARDHHARLKSLEHPNLLRIRELDADAGCVLYTTDLRKSIPLDEYLQRGPGFLEAEVALDLLLPLGEGIAQLHQEGLVHGDLSPASILVEEGTDRAYLASLPICGVLGLPGQPSCDPSCSANCPMEPVARKHWPPIAPLDIEGYAALVYYVLTGAARGEGGPGEEALHPGIREILDKAQETPIESENPARMEDLLEALRVVRKSLQRKAVERRSRAARLRQEGARKKLDRRNRLRRAGDRARLEALEARQRTLGYRFSQLGFLSRSFLFLCLAVASSQIPLEALVAQEPPPPAPTRRPKPSPRPKPKPGAGTTTPGKPKPSATPKTPNKSRDGLVGRTPAEKKLLALADQTWEHPTGTKEVFSARFKGLWNFLKSMPMQERDEVGSKGALTKLRKVVRKRPVEGYRELDRMIQKGREYLKQAITREQEEARARGT